MKSKRNLITVPLAICLIYLVACVSSKDTVIKNEKNKGPSTSEIQFDFADGLIAIPNSLVHRPSYPHANNQHL